MIRVVQLRGWRAFDTLSFEPGPGVTFVLARNGTGKTSLLDGIAWACFGDRSGIDAASMRRIGHSTASTVVELDHPHGEVLTIERTLGSDPVGSLGSTPLTGVDLDAALRQVFGANLDFTARAVTLGHSTLLDHARSFEYLEAHLADVFGITDLRDATEQMETRYSGLKAANQKLRAAAKQQADPSALRARSAELETEIAALSAELEAANERYAQADTAADHARAAAREAAALVAWQTADADLRTHAAALLGTVEPDLADQLRRQIDDREATVSALTLRIGRREATIAAATAAAATLQDSGTVCPTCQRPLSRDEREAAGHAHQQNLDLAQQEITSARAELTDITTELRTLRQLLGNAERLGDAPNPSTAEVDPDAVEATLRDARAQLDRVNREAQQRRGALAEITRTLATMAADEAAEAERFRSIRKEAVAQLTADLMRRTVTALMDERVTPIADEVSARWKQVFGERGTLQLTAQGAITMVRDGHTIGFQHFSPGEQVVSMLALRFLTVAASTSSPFMLLDEPLECLDPPNRRLIASVIAGPDRPVGQMIVTTYEDALVRRIRETVPGTDVRIIN